MLRETEHRLWKSLDHLKMAIRLGPGLGRIFHREAKAAEIIVEEERKLVVIASKTAKIPVKKHQRVMRLMGHDKVAASGDDSFQNEHIRAAGGIAPMFGKKGNIISVSLEEWQAFNPQVLYGCGDDRQILSMLFAVRPYV